MQPLNAVDTNTYQVPCYCQRPYPNYHVMHPNCRCCYKPVPCQSIQKSESNTLPTAIEHSSAQSVPDKAVCPIKKTSSCVSYQIPCWAPCVSDYVAMYPRTAEANSNTSSVMETAYGSNNLPTTSIAANNKPQLEPLNVLSNGPIEPVQKNPLQVRLILFMKNTSIIVNC